MVVFLLGLVGLAGCTPPTRRPTTRITVEDFDAMTAAMAQSLLDSDALNNRGPASPLWIVSVQKVTNLSSDVMTSDEQWAIMAQLVGSMPIQSLWTRKNVRFVLPARRVEQLRHDPDRPEFGTGTGFGARRHPTHVMTATFRSITRAQEDQRTDLYYTQFEIVDLRTGEPVWQDRFEYQRAARGSIHD